MVFEERLTRLINIKYLVGDDNRLFMESWHLWKASYRFCWRCRFRLAILFSVSFFASYFSCLLSATSIYCATLALVRYIPVLKSGFLVEVSPFTNLTFFLFSIVMHYLFISWIGMTVLFLAALYASSWRIMFLDDFCVPFDQRTTIGSSVLVTCNLIGATVWLYIFFISSALYPEDNWMEAENYWVFFVKLIGIRGGRFFFSNMSLMMLPADNLKASHD